MKAVWRIIYIFYRAFSWARHRAVRRLTQAGWAVLLALVISGGMGIHMESTVAYQAFTVLFFLLLVSISFGWTFRARFSAVRQLPRFGTVGKPFEYAVAVANLTPNLQASLTLIEDLADARPKFPEWLAAQLAEQKSARSMKISRGRRSAPAKFATVKEVNVPNLAPKGEAEVRVELTPLRRGILRFESVTMARPDPLGLFRALVKVPIPETVLILPKRYFLPPIALPGIMKYQEGGVALASNVGQSEEFVALRDYRRGDPLRHIHWRSWARIGKPIVKEFADEFFVRHALVLDTFSDQPNTEIFEEAVSVAASFACTIRSQESLLDLLFVGAEAYCFTAGRGLAHVDQMLEILAAVKTNSNQSFEILESLVLNHVGAVSGCICIFLAWDGVRRKFVEKLKAAGVPLLVVVILSSAPDEPLDAGPMRNEPEQFYTLVLGQIEEGLAKL